MGRKIASRLPRLSGRDRIRSPSLLSPKSVFGFCDKENEKSNFTGCYWNGWEYFDSTEVQKESENGNKIMVVVDSSAEAKRALEWTLSHTVQSQDTLFLLHVIKPSKSGAGRINLKAYELLHLMKRTSQARRPGVQVVVGLQEGEKGPKIIEAAREQNVHLLVLGCRKQTRMWRFLKRWVGSMTSCGVVEYCIQNADCMAIAVRRKSKKAGGYSITTKRHKNFWLLA